MSHNGRVLVLDDEEDWRKQLEEMLQKSGYYAKAIGTVAEALAELQNAIYHTLILDIRMEENNTENEEGIVLLEKLKELGLNDATKVIILSAYGTKERMYKAFQKYEVADFLEKGAPDTDLIKTVHEVFATKVHINPALQIHWQQIRDARQAVTNLEINDTLVKPNTKMQSWLAIELEDLLCRLFHRANSILVRPLTQGHSGTGILRVKPYYTNGNGHDVIVKFGDYHKISNEYHNFNEYVQPYLGGGRNTTVLNFRRTSHLGGIIISLLGTINDQLLEFGDFYSRADASRINAALNRLFNDTCGVWYANRGYSKPLDLATSYLKLLEFDLQHIEQIVAEQLPAVEVNKHLRFKHLRNNKPFTNPFSAIIGVPYSISTYTCITHGDFNQRNLLVDSNDHVWMLDFQETGEGHILRDIARLDSVIRFQLLTTEEAKLSERWQLERALIGHFSQIEQVPNELTTTNPALLKAFSVVLHLRTFASELIAQNQDKHMQEYYVALLFNALHTIKFPTLSPIQREHALLSASLLADLLESSN